MHSLARMAAVRLQTPGKTCSSLGKAFGMKCSVFSVLTHCLALSTARWSSNRTPSVVHNDMEVPDLSYYRRSSVMDPTARNKDSHAERLGHQYLMTTSFGALGVYCAKQVHALNRSQSLDGFRHIYSMIESFIYKYFFFVWKGGPDAGGVHVSRC